jgi:hypothetical protein
MNIPDTGALKAIHSRNQWSQRDQNQTADNGNSKDQKHLTDQPLTQRT